jgi:hypothetical protein
MSVEASLTGEDAVQHVLPVDVFVFILDEDVTVFEVLLAHAPVLDLVVWGVGEVVAGYLYSPSSPEGRGSRKLGFRHTGFSETRSLDSFLICGHCHYRIIPMRGCM